MDGFSNFKKVFHPKFGPQSIKNVKKMPWSGDPTDPSDPDFIIHPKHELITFIQIRDVHICIVYENNACQLCIQILQVNVVCKSCIGIKSGAWKLYRPIAFITNTNWTQNRFLGWSEAELSLF